ncbi:MAG: glycosyltransferase [Pseudomonadota bacterium]
MLGPSGYAKSMTDTAPIAYLASEYPALSHTFIQREIAGVRATGRAVLTASLRRTSGHHIAGEAEAAEAAETFYVIENGKKPKVVLSALGDALKSGRFFKALGLAWKIRAPGAKAALWQLFYLLEAVVLARHLKARGVAHLHCHFENAGCSVAMLTSALSGIPFSFTLHGPSIFFEPHRQRLDEKIARADFVACISDFARSQGMIFGARDHWDKMKIVHCGVEPDRYGATLAEDGQHLVFVGRLAAVKGVAMLLRAVADLAATHPDLRLTLIGDGPERTSLEALAGELGVNGQVTFAGARTQAEVAETLSTANLFVLPSFAEGVPVVLMEAMAARLPVITTRIAGIPELVEDGVAGRLVPPGNLDALVAAIKDLLADPAAAKAMGAAGRAKVEAEFDISKEAAKIAAMFTS